jgi:hypothetical protein
VNHMDNLDTLSDAELNEAFAVDVAGWVMNSTRTSGIDPTKSFEGKPPSYATSADAVLPWLERHGWHWDHTLISTLGTGDYKRRIRIYGPTKRDFIQCDFPWATSFARAACIALIRSARKGATP